VPEDEVPRELVQVQVQSQSRLAGGFEELFHAG
jgi:hypothetical protein